ncbi:F-box/LRR-repeat protein At5g02910-like [Solanum tuberosum]|nr:PREDICTED: F-box/LRR-repeat protein At5g02910-like [Solanum tuberosum]XP_006363821.1 PREDICTED: F-box/LRR-repeat protein At5g02910-like [Solanum tuberosum]
MNLERKCSVTTMGDQDQSPGSSGDDGHSKGQILENLPQEKVNIETECEETGIDWISELPDALIVQILSQMPIQDAFKTSILSKRWQYPWTSIDNLIFDNRNTNWSDRENVINKFISFTDNVLPLLCCSKIKKFCLYFRFCLVASYSSKIDKWLEIALKKKVEDLDLEIWYYDQNPYVLPQVLCNNSSIVKFNCEFCRIPEECVLNWTSLKSLTLTYLFLRDEHVEQIVTNCPQLESLKLCEFCGFHRLHITSPKCRSLQLIDQAHPDGDWGPFGGDCSFEIVAPYIQHLKISGHFDNVEIRLGDLSSLVHADLTFSVDVVFDKTVALLLASVRCANELMIPCWFIEMIYVSVLEKKKDVPLLMLKCKQLTINSWISRNAILGIGVLLKSTPYLENLTILHEEGDFFVWDEDLEDEEFDWSGDNSLSLHENIFKGSLQNLKHVEVTSNCCSCQHKADATERLSEFLKSLLEHAKNLEKLVIAPWHNGCNISSANISKVFKNLLAFPGASNIAVVSLGSVSGVDFSGE